jgi:hypothetical protein
MPAVEIVDFSRIPELNANELAHCIPSVSILIKIVAWQRFTGIDPLVPFSVNQAGRFPSPASGFACGEDP